MERIIVTFRKENGQEIDLEVPREVRAADLVQELALVFGTSNTLHLFAEPLNRLLAPHETLADAGIWDGARLILTSGSGRRVPVSNLSPVHPTQPPNLPPGGPVIGWRPLDLGGHSPSPSSEPPPSAGFVWKQIDED